MTARELFDAAELVSISSALQAMEARCTELMKALDAAPKLRRHERQDLELAYTRLKTDIKAIAKTGTVDGSRRPVSRAEQCWFEGAAKKAAIALRPATNSHPINSRWFGAVQEAQMEFSYMRHNLERYLQGGE